MPKEAREMGAFEAFLMMQREGGLVVELDDALRNLVSAVDTTGKGGTVTLKLTVKPSGKDTTGAVLVSDLITVKAPESHPEHFYFVDQEYRLTRQNERQLALGGPLLEVAEHRATDLKEPRA